MVDTKTIETFLKEANGSLQPAHRLILEDFLKLETKLRTERITPDRIRIEIEDMANIKRQYKITAAHELNIQSYRVEQMRTKLNLYDTLGKQCEQIISSYQPIAHTPDVETHPASLTEYGHS